MKKNWGPFSPFYVSSVERKRRLHKTCSSKEAKSIDNAIFAFSIDSRRHFGKLTSKFVLEEVIFSNLWQFLHLSLKTNNNVVQQLEMICGSLLYAEEEYEALVEEEEHEEHKPVYTEDE